jgi:high-affinity iron transporter
MIPAFLLALREGLEAALILGIVLSVLRRVGRRDQARMVGVGFYALGISFEGRSEEIFEGLAMLLAAGVLTWMIFWMERQSRSIQAELEWDVQRAATGGGKWAVFSLAFVAVFREGIELALFLTAAAFTATAAAVVGGALLGLGAAVLAGWAIFATTTRLDVGAFFRVTSILLIFFAAGLVAHGVHELNEAGIVPAVIEHVWDLNPVLDENSGLGQILKALFGYNGNPSLTEIVAYVGYWLVVLGALRYRQTQARQAASPA